MFFINGQNNDNLVVCNRNSMPQQDSQRECFLPPSQLCTSPTHTFIHSDVNTSVPSRYRLPLPDAFIVSSSACSSQNSPTNLIKNKQNFVQPSLPCCSSNCSSIRTVNSGTSYSNNSEQQNNLIKMSDGGIINQLRPSSIGSTAIADPTNSVNGSITTNSSAALIAETLQQIDRLGLELDNYCTGLDIESNAEEKKYFDKQENIHTDKNKQKLPPPVPPKRIENFCPPSNVRFRNDSNFFGQEQNKTVQPPPLPERRNSTISAATPTAPSIADIRSACVIPPLSSMTMSMPISFNSAIPSIKKEPSQIFNHVPNQTETLFSLSNYHNQ
ncbi:unnamed protein product [Meloidogyne enterolobii]|uniref:Uncharacterized protein n=1 Tax=Meloidogyne enterolobii TaxID=390850 RepID=A0ACB0ZBI9_MELEN